MGEREDYLYWLLAFQLVNDKQYRLANISEAKNEMWLEKQGKEGPKMIRLVRFDLDWANRVKQDLEHTAALGERLRKSSFSRELDIFNIYVSKHAPFDETAALTDPISQGKLLIESYILDREDSSRVLQALQEKVGPLSLPPLKEEYEEVEIFQLEQALHLRAADQADKDRRVFEYGKPFFTYVLIAIQLVMFALLEFNGGSTNTETLVEYGAKYNPAIISGEWWRFFTPIFLHIGVLHLLMNTLALYYMGTMVEKIFGRARFLWIYLLSGLAGSAASFALSDHVSAGASGAIFGCFGALLYVGILYPKLFFRTIGTNVIMLIGVNLVFGFSVSGIDNAGHIGGLIGGFLATGAVRLPKKKNLLWQAASFVVLAAALAVTIFTGYNAEHPGTVNEMAKRDIDSGNFQSAYTRLSELADKGKGNEVTYFYLSYAEIQLNKLEDAKKHLEQVIRLNRDFHEAYFNLGLIYLDEGDIGNAKKNIEKAIKIADDPKYKEVMKQIEQTEAGNGE